MFNSTAMEDELMNNIKGSPYSICCTHKHTGIGQLQLNKHCSVGWNAAMLTGKHDSIYFK